MDVKTVIDKDAEERVLIYARSRSRLVCDIEELVQNSRLEIMGYRGEETVKLDVSQIYCFICEGDRVYALNGDGKWRLRQRLYQIEELLGESFCRINQSCIANLNFVRKFDASISGTLYAVFQNGYKDYISRRQLKNVKERVGLKK